MSPPDDGAPRGGAPVGRRAYLSLALAASTGGCSLLGDRDVRDSDQPDDGPDAATDEEPTTTDAERPMTTEPPPPGVATSLADGDLVAVGAGLDYVSVSADRATPVQDALDLVDRAGGGHVYLPPGETRNEGTVRPHRNTGLYGFGMDVSALKITGAGADGIRFDQPGRAHWVTLDGFELRGPGPDGPTGAAIHFVDTGASPASDPADFRVGHLYCRQWNDAVYLVDEGVGPFQCRHQFLRADDCDAGGARALIDWRSTYGPANWFGTVISYPTDRYSGRNTRVLGQRGGELAIDDISVGGTAGRMVGKRAGRLRVGRLHYEPERQPAVPESLVRLGGVGQTRIEDVIVDAGAVERVYELRDRAGDAVLFRPTTARGAVRRAVLEITGPLHPEHRSWYFGSADDVRVQESRATGSLRVMGEAGEGMG